MPAAGGRRAGRRRGTDRRLSPAASLAGLPPLRDTIAAHGLSARRSLGQHFLLDLNVARRIARAAAPFADVTVLEIGPGPGGLTRALLEAGAERVVAVEKDRRFLPALGEIAAASGGRLEVVEGDALAVDPARLAPGPRALRAVANLPYNVATALLGRWLDSLALFDRLVLTFQKEVADRMLAAPGTAAYGRLSVAVQWRCEATRLFDLPPQVFVPPPRGRSSVVALAPRDATRGRADPGLCGVVAAAAFGQRRKMLRTALGTLFARPRDALGRCGIPERARAGELDAAAYGALARALEEERSADGRK